MQPGQPAATQTPTQPNSLNPANQKRNLMNVKAALMQALKSGQNPKQAVQAAAASAVPQTNDADELAAITNLASKVESFRNFLEAGGMFGGPSSSGALGAHPIKSVAPKGIDGPNKKPLQAPPSPFSPGTKNLPKIPGGSFGSGGAKGPAY